MTMERILAAKAEKRETKTVKTLEKKTVRNPARTQRKEAVSLEDLSGC
jgi:hypothetical protein